MTTPTSMGNHGGTVTSCSPYAYPGFAEICILHRTWSTVALGTYELAFLIKKKRYVTGNLPIPHPKHNCRNRALQHNVQASFSEFWRPSLPIRAIRSCGIEALSHLSPHLEQLHMLALWGSLWVTAMPGVAT